MKPKDLLEHLEKGDRTMHHLTKKPEAHLFNTSSRLVNAFNQGFGTSGGPFIMNAMNTMQNSMWNQQAGAMTTGGLLRW